MNDNLTPLPEDYNHTTDGIAIVGLAVRVPGAENAGQFWENLVAEKETISTFSPEEISDIEPKTDPDYVARRGILKDPDHFDASFFNMAPREAEATDPQQRVFLEAAWHALEDAGVDPARSSGLIGVFAGMSNNSYFQSHVEFNEELREQVGQESINVANGKDYLATRVAYKLNLRGPALNIYTACSTSLVAVCQAVQSLQTFQCDVALAGGVSVKFPQERGYLYQEGSIYSPDGHCRSFDAVAGGTVFGNGLGVVVLKRLQDAVKAGDRVYAVIRGAALNNDGAEKVSFTAPSVTGHADVIALAQALGDVTPDTISYVECHGTATPIGDPIEIAGLTEAFRSGGAEAVQFCAIGSVKSNLGHLDAAAGVVGLIKTAQALHHRVLPASLHFQRPNPELNLESSPFYVNARTKPWPKGTTARRAGVSSFGVGGTNAHVVLEEAEILRPRKESGGPHLLVLSAKSPAALKQQRQNLAEHFRRNPDASVAAATWVLQSGRATFAHRALVIAESASEAAAKLSGEEGRDFWSGTALTQDPPVVFLFPGQGSQHRGMGMELASHDALFRETLQKCIGILKGQLEVDLSDLLGARHAFGPETERLLAQTRYAQPALFAVEYAMAASLLARGVHPHVMLGHSVGEYVAACLSGVFSLEDALKLVTERGRLMWECTPGAMLTVRKGVDELKSLLHADVEIAVVNGPQNVVLSGPHPAIEAMESIFKEKEIPCRRLETSHAFHSQMMQPCLEKFRQTFGSIQLSHPTIPWISNVTGEVILATEAISPEYWVRQLRSTVRFGDGLTKLADRSVLVEVGPGNALAQLARMHPKAGLWSAITSLMPPAKDAGSGEVASFHTALGKLWIGGLALDWTLLNEGSIPHKVSLPGYPFERQRYCAALSLPEGARRVGETGIIVPVQPLKAAVATKLPETVPIEFAPPSILDRRERLLAELRQQLHQASGIDVSTAPESASFFDLGFDSLFLTQAALFLKKRFSVKITFRQLAGDLGSLGALAAHLHSVLPADRVEATAANAVSSEPSGKAVRAIGQSVNPDGKITFGPFRPMQTSEDGHLTEMQTAHLQELLGNYLAKTQRSREHTQKYREVLADPRAVAGFNPLWKEAIYPLVVGKSEGGRVWDLDGNEYIDITLGFGVGFLGHKPPFVIEAVKRQLDEGFEIGPTSPLAGEVAEMVREFTGMERVTFCNTGSEALMAAIRVSRTVSGRDKIVMFAGAYHGIFDEVLMRPRMDGEFLRSMPIAPGIPASAAENILVLEYGNPGSLEMLREHADSIAAVLVETVQSRRPELQPAAFLHELREITASNGIALVLDEVVNGFRVHQRGAQGWFGVEADIATYGKVAGGGLPVGIVAGKRKYMDALDGGFWQYGDASQPEVGMTFFAGTFVRHPLALAAVKSVLQFLKAEGPQLQERMNQAMAGLVSEMNSFCEEVGVPIRAAHFSSFYFLNFASQLRHTDLLFMHMRLRGIYTWPGRCGFLCIRHTESDIDRILHVFKESILALQKGGFLPDATSQAIAACPPLPILKATMDQAPLTPAQQEMYLASQMSQEMSSACHESVSLLLEGPVNSDWVCEALQNLVSRHDALRCSFPDGREQMQVSPEARIAVDFADLTSLEIEDRDAKLESFVDEQFKIPFDLSHGPLLRALLVRLADDRHQLCLTAHHIICDGWSFGVLIQEFPWAYQKAAGVQIEDPPDVPSYLDYAREVAAAHDSPEARESRGFWLAQYQSVPQPLQLPTEGSPGVALDSGRVRADISNELTEQIRDFCREHRLTPYHFLLALWQVLLHRLSGSRDFVTGIPFALQPGVGQPGLCGHCVHFLPLRVDFSHSVAFLDFAHRIKAQMLESADHLDCTLGEILDGLKLSAAQRRGFASTVFSLESAATTAAFHGIRLTPVPNLKRRQQFDLAAYVYQADSSLELVFNHRRALISEDSAQRWLGHYLELIKAALSNPSMDVSRLRMGPEMVATAPICLAANETRTLVDWFETTAAAHSDRIAASCEGRSMTYAELNEQSNRLANYLISRGVQPGDLIGVCLERTLDLLVGILAILKSGAAYLPVDLSYPKDRLAFIMEDSGAALVVTEAHLISKLPVHRGSNVLMDAMSATLMRQPTTNPGIVLSPDALAYVIYTSGSTGKPKGCLVTHHNVVRLMTNTQPWYGFGTDDVWTLFHSAAFDFSVWEIWGALLYGGRLVVVPFLITRSPDEFYQLLSREKVTVLNQTPSAFRQLMAVEETLPQLLPLALRYIIFGGEALEMTSLKPWFARHGDTTPKLVNMYGITETTVHVTYRPLRADDTDGGSVIGIPIPDLQLYILDDNKQRQPVGVAGEMYVGGAGLARGYLNRPELTAERFISDHLSGVAGARLYRTGDLARRLSNGDIEYLGRIDQQVKIRGFRIELGEIESVILSHEDVRDCAVLALPGTQNGDPRLCAWLVCGVESPPSLRDLRDYLGSKLPEYMIPSAFVFLDRLPLTTNGKLDRAALPAPESASGAVAVDAFVAPTGTTEIQLATLWADILGGNHISREADFFALGGTSLNGLRLFSSIRKDFRVALPLATLFNASTLQKLAAVIDEAGISRKQSSPLALIQQGTDGLPPIFCIHGGDGGALFYKNLLPSLGKGRSVYTIESPALVDDSLPIEAQAIEEVAAEYLALVRFAQPHGPYLLGGYSYGGIVAYEMARQLLASGETVLRLVMFDTDNPTAPTKAYSLAERIAVNWRTNQGAGVAGKLLRLGERFSTGLVQRLRIEAETAAARKMLKQGQRAEDERLRHVQIRETNVDALAKYQPGAFAGTMLLFRSDEVSDKYLLEEDYGWSGLVAKIDIERIPGKHLEIFDSPFVENLGSKLRLHLDALSPSLLAE